LQTAFAQTIERAESELAITALPTLASNWLVPRLGAFQLACPKLAVRLNTRVALADLTQGSSMSACASAAVSGPVLTRTDFYPIFSCRCVVRS
jgi:DNA-binding transcriptional LysR family regulator